MKLFWILGKSFQVLRNTSKIRDLFSGCYKAPVFILINMHMLLFSNKQAPGCKTVNNFWIQIQMEKLKTWKVFKIAKLIQIWILFSVSNFATVQTNNNFAIFQYKTLENHIYYSINPNNTNYMSIFLRKYKHSIYGIIMHH